jgi:hypothetical protein
MKPIRLAIAAVVLLVLGAAVWYSEKHPPEPTTKTEPVVKVLSIADNQIEQLRIIHPAGETVALEKGKDGKWQMTEPKPYHVDESAVSSLISSFSSINADQVLAENNSDWKGYGLDPGKVIVDASLKGGKHAKLILGDEAPTGSALYARLDGSPKLYSIATYQKSNFDKSAADLRDKRLLPLETDKISRVTLTVKDKMIEFGRSGTGSGSNWQILKPHPMRADSFAVDDLVRAVSDAKFDSEEREKTAAAYATFEAVDSSGTHKLTVTKDKDTYLARSTDLPGFFKIASSTAESLNKDLTNFRNKRLFEFGGADPEKLDLRDGGTSFSIEKKGEKWFKAGKEISADKASALMSTLRRLEAKSFAGDDAAAQRRNGLDKPVVEVKAGNEHVVWTDAKDDKCYAARDKDPTSYEVSAGDLADLRKAIVDLK